MGNLPFLGEDVGVTRHWSLCVESCSGLSPRKQWQERAGSGFVFLFPGTLLQLGAPPGVAECDKGGGLMVVCGKERLS